MSEILFPRTEVAGISMPRMIIGSNWFCGYSHTGHAADVAIKQKFGDEKAFAPVLETYLDNGIDAIMGLLEKNPMMKKAVYNAQEKTGKKIHVVDTPQLNVDDNPMARMEAQKTIETCAKNGAEFCLIHHASCEQLVCKNTKTINRLDDYTKMIRDAGMVPGLSAHMPEMVIYSDLNEYDVQTYIQIYNPMGFLMQVEIEFISKVIHNAKKPVMTIKPFAAGRCTPYVGLNFVYNTIRDCDMVTIGVSSELEALEDIEIAKAAIGRYHPNVQGRTSPVTNQAAFSPDK